MPHEKVFPEGADMKPKGLICPAGEPSGFAFLCIFQPIMSDLQNYLRQKICRWNSRWVEGFLPPLLKIDVVISSLMPLFETGTYNLGSLCFIPPWDVSGALNLPWKNPGIFKGGSVFYGMKSIGRPDRTPLKSESGKVSVMDYQWQYSIFRGCFYQVIMQSPYSYGV